jgi:hypothetical protein
MGRCLLLALCLLSKGMKIKRCALYESRYIKNTCSLIILN